MLDGCEEKFPFQAVGEGLIEKMTFEQVLNGDWRQSEIRRDSTKHKE